MHVALRLRSGCLLTCLGLSMLTLVLQTLWVPLEDTSVEHVGRSPEAHGQNNVEVQRLALSLQVLNSQVQKLGSERGTKMTREDLSLLLQSFKRDHRGLAHMMERELRRVSLKLDLLSRKNLQKDQTPPLDKPVPLEATEECDVPIDPAYPLCSEKVKFLQARWQSDPCYAFYGIDGTTCSILSYLRQIEDFCPPQTGQNSSVPRWQQTPPPVTKKAEIRASLKPLFEVIANKTSPALEFVRSRVERMSGRWIRAGLTVKRSSNRTDVNQMKVLLYPGALAGAVGQQFESMVERGGPLGELVQWADLGASLTILGHNVTLGTSLQHLHSLIAAAPGQGSCPIQAPLTFDLIYTDYHGLAHLQGGMGLSFLHYKCRFRILDSFGTEPAFNLESYAHKHGYTTLWGSWGLQPRQYMTMFPHTPDNSFLGFVTEEPESSEVREEELDPFKKDKIAVVYGKRDYMWKGKSEYVNWISEELETHATVYQSAGHAAALPDHITNHGLLNQKEFLRLLRRAKVFVGLGFPFEGPAPIEAIALGCIFLQPRLDPPQSSDNNDFYRGKPTTRQISSQHPYTKLFIGKPHVWTVDVNNRTEVLQAMKDILHTEVKPFTPREFTFEGMLERLHYYISHQNFCSKADPAWPPETAMLLHLGPLGQSCVSVCQHSSLVCEPSLFDHINSQTAFIRLGLGCSSTVQEVTHLFPAYSPWGRLCGLQQEPLLFSCAGSDPTYRRLCPCRTHVHGQVALWSQNP